MEPVNEISRFYKENFNPAKHLSFIKDNLLTEHPSILYVRLLHEFMQASDVKGKDVLEVACGPSILLSIVLSQYYENLYLSDYLDRNVQFILTWLDDKPGQPDFQPFFDYAGECLGKGSYWPSGPTQIKKKIRGVIKFDVYLPEVLPFGVTPRSFDCVTGSYVLASACSSDTEVNKAVSNMASLLNPGGMLILYESLKCKYYTVDGTRYKVHYLTDASICMALEEAGFQLVHKQHQNVKLDEAISDCESFALYVGKKDNK